MNTQTDERFGDNVDLIEVLHRVGSETYPPREHNADQMLARVRRARRRHRAFVASASSVAIAGVAALAIAMIQIRASDKQTFLAPAGLGLNQSPSSVTRSDPNYQVLEEALGSDFSIDSESGEVTVKAGSPSAKGLPTGLALGTQIFVLEQSPQSGELSQFCKATVEKNVIFSTCTSQVLSDGVKVYVQWNHTGAGGVKPGRSPDYLASDGVRILFEQPDSNLVIVDLGTQEMERNSSAQRRADATAWLQRISPRLVNAATDSRVVDGSPRSSPKATGSAIPK